MFICKSFIDCKITNSNRRNLNLKPKRLYFNYFKDRFIHFNRTVVIIYISFFVVMWRFALAIVEPLRAIPSLMLFSIICLFEILFIINIHSDIVNNYHLVFFGFMQATLIITLLHRLKGCRLQPVINKLASYTVEFYLVHHLFVFHY